MRILLVTALAATASGCGAGETSDQHHSTVANCAVRPAGFHDYGAPDFTTRWPVPTGGYQKNVVRITRAGAILWNEVDLKSDDEGGERTLGLYLTAVRDFPDQPFTVLAFEPGAPCATIDSIRRLMVEHLGCSATDRCFQARVAQR